MTVRRLISDPHILWQKADGNSCHLPEPALGIHVDAGGVLVLEQEDRHITLNWASLPELIGLLKDLAKRRPRS